MSPRTLFIVAVLALVSVAVAAVVVSREARDPHFDLAGQAVFPGLIDRVNEIDRLTVESMEGTLHLHRNGAAWRLRESDDHTADQSEVGKAIVAVAGLTYFEPKTRRPDRYAKLELGPPGEPGSKGRRLVLGIGDKVVADLVVGRERLFLPGLTVGGVYFRLTGDAQTWLGEGKPEAGPEPRDWLARKIVNIDDRRVRRVTVRHPAGETVVVSRADVSAETFILHDVPEGMKLQYDTDAEHIGQLLEGLEMDDARLASGVPFEWTGALIAEVETFDGLRGTVETIGKGSEDWLRLRFEGTTDETRREADRLNAATRDWVYRVPKYEVIAIQRRMRDLLVPAGRG